jgi:hypothetical protein
MHCVTVIRRFTRENNTLSLPLFFFSVRRLFWCIILVSGLSLGELPNLFVLNFLGQTLISCILSWLWKKRLYTFHIVSFSSIRHCRKSRKISSQLTTDMRHTHFRIFESVLDFQSKKQNRAEFNVHKRIAYLVFFFLWGKTLWIWVSKQIGLVHLPRLRQHL